jgi:hypothetical protein
MLAHAQKTISSKQSKTVPLFTCAGINGTLNNNKETEIEKQNWRK